MWTILFDIDGTLIRTHAGMSAMGQAVTEHYGLTDIPDIRVHGRTDHGIVNELFSKLDLSLEADRKDFMGTYCRFLKIKLEKDGGELLPGVIELLDILRQRDDVALGVLTGNAKQPADIKLDHFELNQYFDFGGFGDDFSDRNDVAAAAAAAAKNALGERFDSSKVWVLGDTVNDVRCARSIGAKALAVETGGDSKAVLEKVSPDFLLSSFANVSSWLASLTPANT